jgi:outer membrane protein assembly factor BamB
MVRQARDVPVELTDRTLLWKVDSRTRRQYPMPAIVDGKVLIGGNGRGNPDPYWGKALTRGGSLVCRSLANGKQLWRLVSSGTDRPGGFGVCGSVIVEGDRVYVLSVYDAYCLDLHGLANGNQGMTDELRLMTRRPFQVPEGESRPTELPDWAADVIWHYSFQRMGIRVQDAVSCTPLSVGDQIWISTANEMGSEARGDWDDQTQRYKTPEPKPHMLVLDKRTGELIAVDEMDVPIVFHGEWSSPSLLEAGGNKAVVFPDGYGVLHGLAIPTPSPDGKPVTLEEYWTFDLNPAEYRYDAKGRRHPYTLDTRLTYKYPVGWLEDPNKWIMPPSQWATYRNRSDELTGSYLGIRAEELKFSHWRARDLTGPGHHDGPCEVIAMPVVVGNRVYLGLGRDYNYAGGPQPEHRTIREGTKKYRKWGTSRFLCMEFDDATRPPRIVWEDRDLGRVQSNASVHDGLVYACDLAGFLNCWQAESGEVVYKLDLGASVRERSQLVVDGKIYVATDRNELIVLKAGREPKELFRTRIRGHIATPNAVDGVLVFVTPREVFAYATDEARKRLTDQ